MKFTVNRSTWLRGEGYEHSALLRQVDGKMCCLGFFCLASGLKPYDIINREAPQRLIDPEQRRSILKSLGEERRQEPMPSDPETILTQLMQMNDSTDLSDAEREEILKELFQSLGHEVIFE
jgi:hypothetical protein